MSLHWADSKWRSLKLKWDEPTSIHRPDRVSPWEIEPYNASTPSLTINVPQSLQIWNKRPKPPGNLQDLSVLAREESSAFWYPGVTQSRDLGVTNSLDSQSCQTSIAWPPKQTENKDCNVVSSTNTHTRGVSDVWLKDLQSTLKSPVSSLTEDVSFRLFQDIHGEREATIPSWPAPGYMAEEHVLKLSKSDEEWKKPKNNIECHLFGIELVNCPSNMTSVEKATVGPVAISSATNKETPVQTDASVDDTDPQKQGLQVSSKEMQSRQNSSIRSHTKVHMQGITVDRAVDLAILDGYIKLIDIKGELHDWGKWEVVFTDDEGDMMLLGDDPWMEFCLMVRKIFISSNEEVKKMKPSSKFFAAAKKCEEGGIGIIALVVQPKEAKT